jgi:hypothetical protein
MSCGCDDSTALATFDLPYYRGDTAPIRAQLLNADGTVYPIDADALIDFAVFATDAADAARLWDKLSGQGIAIIDAAQGVVAITPTSAESAALVVGVTYPALFRLTDGGGALVTLGKGYLRAL